MAAFLVWNAVLLAVSWYWARHLLGPESADACLPRTALACFILFFGSLVAVCYLLAPARLMGPEGITAVIAAVGGLTLWHGVRRMRILGVCRLGTGSAPHPVLRQAIAAYWQSLLVSLVAGTFLFLAAAQFIFCLPPLTTDGLLYHLPFAVHYARERSLSLPLLFFVDTAMTYYPPAGDIPYFYAIFAGVEPLLNVVQMPFVLMGALAVFLIGTRLGMSEQASTAAACIFCLLEPIAKQATLTFVDLMLTGCFLAAVAFFSSQKKEEVALGFVASGLLIAIKPTGGVFLLCLMPLAVRQLPLFRRNPAAWASLAYAALIGGFGYLRNMVLTGNPFYPARIAIGSLTLFPGTHVFSRGSCGNVLAGCVRSVVNPSSMTDALPSTNLILALLFLAGAVGAFLWKRPNRHLLLIPCAVAILYLLVVPPFYHQLRHFLPLYGLIVVSACVFLSGLPRSGAWLAVLLLFAVVRSPTAELLRMVAVPVAVTHGAVFLLLQRLGRARLTAGVTACSLLLLAAAFTLVLGARREVPYREARAAAWQRYYGEEGRFWVEVQRRTAVPDEPQTGWWPASLTAKQTIAYVGEFLLYPLLGGDLRTDVVYQSVNSVETLPVHRYPAQSVELPGTVEQRASFYRQAPDVDIWLEGLRRKNVRWIVIRTEGEFVERQWLDSRPDIFSRVFENSYAQLWAVRASPL